MAYLMFNGKTVTLQPTNEGTVKELLKVMNEIGFEIPPRLRTGAVNPVFRFYALDTKYLNLTRMTVALNPKSLNEWVTELYKYKRSLGQQ